jgi:indolepyruvate ferredoxin oxidoreductase beta subunit
MKSVIFAGVGGQGVILASKVLMEVAMKAGFDVRESEVHGMAQRGGSVECNVRFGDKVYSPLIPKGGADFIIGFEMLEAMRKLDYLNDNGTLIVNRLQIPPAPVLSGDIEYPSDIEPWITENVKNHAFVDTTEELKAIGSSKSLNIMMLGVLSHYLDFPTNEWHNAIQSQIKEKFIEINISAFDKGRNLKRN